MTAIEVSESAQPIDRVSRFKRARVRRYDKLVQSAPTMAELLDGFVAEMCATLVADAPMHELWYELRRASADQEPLRAAVALIDSRTEDMISRVVLRYACLAERDPALTPSTLYAIIDGLFQQALAAMPQHPAQARDRFERSLRELFPSLLAAA